METTSMISAHDIANLLTQLGINSHTAQTGSLGSWSSCRINRLSPTPNTSIDFECWDAGDYFGIRIVQTTPREISPLMHNLVNNSVWITDSMPGKQNTKVNASTKGVHKYITFYLPRLKNTNKMLQQVNQFAQLIHQRMGLDLLA